MVAATTKVAPKAAKCGRASKARGSKQTSNDASDDESKGEESEPEVIAPPRLELGHQEELQEELLPCRLLVIERER